MLVLIVVIVERSGVKGRDERQIKNPKMRIWIGDWVSVRRPLAVGVVVGAQTTKYILQYFTVTLGMR